MGSRVVTPEDVLETLMNDGTIDAIRLKIINQLKANEELKNKTINMVEQSKVLNTPGAEKQTKRELFDALRRELEAPVLEKASGAVWELIINENMLGKEISETIERAYCRLSGLEMLPPPPSLAPRSETQEQWNEKAEEDKEKPEKDQGMEICDSSSRKRTFGEINEKGGSELVEDDSTNQTLAALDDIETKVAKPKT